MLNVLFTDLFNCNTSTDERDVILLFSLKLTFFLHLKTDLSTSCHVGLHSGINIYFAHCTSDTVSSFSVS